MKSPGLRFHEIDFLRGLACMTYPLYVVHQNLGFMIYGRLHKASGMVTVSLVLMLAALLLISWCIHAYVERSLSQVLRRWLVTFPSALTS